MKRDDIELLIHRTLAEWLKERDTVQIALADYLSLVELLVYVIGDTPNDPLDGTLQVPVKSIVQPDNGTFCTICNAFVPYNHMWTKHRITKSGQHKPGSLRKDKPSDTPTSELE